LPDTALYHGGPASNGLKALLALYEKGVEFEPRFIDLRKFRQHEPDYLKINPAGQVPALLHQGRILTESTVIAEYVDAVFDGPPLRPADEWDRAQMRIWTKYVDEVFRPSLSFLAWQAMMPGLRAAMGEENFEERLKHIPLAEKRDKWELAAKGGFSEREIATWRRNLEEVTARIEQGLAEGSFLVGDTPTLADYACFAMGYMMPVGHPDLVNPERTPRMIAWIERLKQRPGVQRAITVPTPGRE